MAGKVRYVDWRPADWLAGTRGLLTMREVAIYDLVLNLIYDRGGNAPNDATYLAGHFKLDEGESWRGITRSTRALVDKLVALGKLHVSHDGEWLSNEPADLVLNKARERINGASRAGTASGRARRARRHTADIPSTSRQHPVNSQRETLAHNDLARTDVRNYQPSILTDTSTESVAARADRPATEGPPARAPDTTPSPSPTSERVAALAKEPRDRQKAPAKQPSVSDQRLAELARQFHRKQEPQ